MRFTNIIAASILAIAVRAQDEEQSGLTAEQKECIAKCDGGDVNCLAHCTPVPSPTEADIAKLNECSAACDQGDGSEAATNAYAECQSDCVLQFYYDPAIGTPGQGQNAGSGSGSGSGSDSDAEGGADSDDDSEDADAEGADGDSEDSNDEDSNGDGEGDDADADDSEEGGDGGSGAASLVVSSLVAIVAAALAL